MNHVDRLFPVNQEHRELARSLYESVKNLPIISPHGHTDPSWFALDNSFTNASSLLLIPDHYVLRMLYSQGISLEELGKKSDENDMDAMRACWKVFAKNYHLFWGTPSWVWLNSVFNEVFGFEEELSEKNADDYFDSINEKLKQDDFKPRALLERFNIEKIATTDEAIDDLSLHKKLFDDGIQTVIPTFRPDRLTDPEHEDFLKHLSVLAELTGEDVHSVKGYLGALRKRRHFFKEMGATATDHGHSSAFTLKLSDDELQKLLSSAVAGRLTPDQAEQFRGAMLFKMAEMSLEDGLVMQIHPGPYRNHNETLFQDFGRDVGADIPQKTEYVKALRPLLNEFGNNKNFKMIVFTLDESTYSRELAPLAGHYPAMKLGPAWWFHDSPEGMLRFRKNVTETAGFYNTVGFNDDTRAFFSIPARHDVSRRIDARFLSEMVLEHRMSEDAARKLIKDLAYNLPKEGYNL